MTIEPKISGAVIPRRVFTQPGSDAVFSRPHVSCPYFPQHRTVAVAVCCASSTQL